MQRTQVYEFFHGKDLDYKLASFNKPNLTQEMEKGKVDQTNRGNIKTRPKSSLKLGLLLIVFFNISAAAPQSDSPVATPNGPSLATPRDSPITTTSDPSVAAPNDPSTEAPSHPSATSTSDPSTVINTNYTSVATKNYSLVTTTNVSSMTTTNNSSITTTNYPMEITTKVPLATTTKVPKETTAKIPKETITKILMETVTKVPKKTTVKASRETTPNNSTETTTKASTEITTKDTTETTAKVTTGTSSGPEETFSKNSASILLSVLAAALLIALITVLTVFIIRGWRYRYPCEMYNQLALKTSQRRTSDGYEVLPGERMSGYYAHIVEDTHMADVYESMSDEGSPEDILCNRQVSCPNNYQRISLDNIKTLPQAISTHSHNYEALLKKSKSCGDLTDGRADISEYFNMKAPIEQEPEPFYSTVGRQTSEKEEQPRLQWFMLRNSKDDIHLDHAFDSTEAHKSTELRDFSTRKHCAADADGEGEYLTVLDSSNEYEGYIKFDGSDVTVIKS